MRLLIVDDSELMRKVTRLAFRGVHELEEAPTGLEALGRLAAARDPFHAIVLDLQMPDMNGAEFLRAVREQPAHRNTPVVIATSESEDSPLLAAAREFGVAAVLRKPWRPPELAAAVDIAVGRKRPAGAGWIDPGPRSGV
jgi:two-component system chemotaxis response regulator CheY